MLRVLIVDDELPARNRLRRMLAEISLANVVGEAASGQEALHLIPATAPDVVLLDISMPGLSGMAVAEVLREQAAPPAGDGCAAAQEWVDNILNPPPPDPNAKPAPQRREYVLADLPKQCSAVLSR